MAYVLDWLNLLLRWAHVAAAIVWLGAAFYLLSLDKQPEGRTWITWPAYLAWLTGFALLVAMYYLEAGAYLIDPQVMALPKWAAIAISIALLIVGLAAYEGVCRSIRNEPVLSVLLLCLLALTACGLTLIYSGRGAFIHYGALLGTIMAGNVAHVLVPVERRAAQALKEGRVPDALDAARARQRSLHNGYLALPVVLAMISNHSATVFAHRWGWLALVALTAAGLLLHAALFMRVRASAWIWLAALLGLAVAGAVTAPEPARVAAPVNFSDVKRVVDARCVPCHAERPSYPGVSAAPKGVKLDTAERLRAQATQIQRQSVLTRVMPPGNLTRLTGEERALLERWVRGGARTD
jgi:uncharacterized membrane protein